MKKITSIAGWAGLVLTALSLIWYSIEKIWGGLNWALLILGVLALAWFIYDYYANRQKEISSMAVKQGSNMVVQIVSVLVVVTLLAFLTTRHHYRTDLTKNNLYSLSGQTLKILENLKKPVTVKAFFKTAEDEGAKDLLSEYGYRSANFSFEMIDPDEQPQIARQYNIKQYNSLAVESGAKREVVKKLNEVNLTNALIKVTSDKDKAIYFTTGHGEHSIGEKGPKGYSKAVEQIRADNHAARSFNLVRRRSVPDSATIVVIASPKVDFVQAELDSLTSYVKKGGKLLMLLDPESPQQLRDFAAVFKIDVADNMVVDASGFGQLFGTGPAVPLVQSYDKTNPITKGFTLMTFFPYASSVKPHVPADGWQTTKLAMTSKQSWGEKDYKTKEVAFNAGVDAPGPVTVAVLAKKKEGNSNSIVIVFGDSDFASNAYFGQQGNGNLFLNTVNYLTDSEDLISIRPKKLENQTLTMTRADVSILFYLVVIIIPLALVIAGVFVFLKRNRS